MLQCNSSSRLGQSFLPFMCVGSQLVSYEVNMCSFPSQGDKTISKSILHGYFFSGADMPKFDGRTFTDRVRGG